MASRAAKRTVHTLDHASSDRPLKRVDIRSRKRIAIPRAVTTPGTPELHSTLFSFTHELARALPTVPLSAESSHTSMPPALPSILPSADDPLPDHIDDPLPDDISRPTKPKHSGKGQNQMMHEWMGKPATAFLRRMIEFEGLPSVGKHCQMCKSSGQIFRCRDCQTGRVQCKDCLHLSHRDFPGHRIQCWNGAFFGSASLDDTEFIFDLGHYGLPCSLGQVKEFVLVDITGIHNIHVRFCKHPNNGGHAQQLLQAKIFPASEDTPASGFTFGLLKLFSLLSAIAKGTAEGFYKVLVAQTNPLFPDTVPDRYREFMRAARQWKHLSDLKRAGMTTSAPDVQPRGDLSLRCPACPRPFINYEPALVLTSIRFLYCLHLAYDGNFKLNRKNKAVDSWDTCLSDGRKYFVRQELFDSFIATTSSRESASKIKDAGCNNHKAVTNSWVRFEGLAETGIGATICARHSFFMPVGTVRFTRGERFAYTDYALTSVLSDALQAGLTDVGVHYDIMCHYQKNMWARWSTIDVPEGPLEQKHFPSFQCAVPKFHLAGHTDQCFVRFSLNHMTGVGRLDGEGGERCWANLNLAARSTSERGPGARVDSICHVMDQWNWSKTVEMTSYILRRHAEAAKMAQQQRQDWLDLHESIDRNLTEQWELMDTSPKLVNGVWTSVFLLKEPEALSLSSQLQRLTRNETLAETELGNPGARQGAATWIVSVLDLEVLQRRVVVDLKKWGAKITARQSQELSARRKAISDKYEVQRASALKFIPESLVQELPSTNSNGQPETLPHLLPSSLPPSSFVSESMQALRATEVTLRRTVCLKALHTIRSLAISRAQLLRSKRQYKRTVANTTTSESYLQRLSDRQKHAVWQYRHSRICLLSLSSDRADEQTFKHFKDEDLKELNATVSTRSDLGEGYVRLPWYWRIAPAPNNDNTVEVPNSSVEQEYQESIRVEWFRSRERALHWEEEVMWLEREAATVINNFDYRACTWRSWRSPVDADIPVAFAKRQEAVWRSLYEDAAKRLLPLLKSGSERIPQCQSVLTDLTERSG